MEGQSKIKAWCLCQGCYLTSLRRGKWKCGTTRAWGRGHTCLPWGAHTQSTYLGAKQHFTSGEPFRVLPNLTFLLSGGPPWARFWTREVGSEGHGLCSPACVQTQALNLTNTMASPSLSFRKTQGWPSCQSWGNKQLKFFGAWGRMNPPKGCFKNVTCDVWSPVSWPPSPFTADGGWCCASNTDSLPFYTSGNRGRERLMT